MAIRFVVEDGTGKSDSTTYVDVVTMKEHWDTYGYDYSSLVLPGPPEDDTAIQILLNKASRSVDGCYAPLFPGFRYKETQALEFPRGLAWYIDGDAIAADIVPIEVINAVCEMAYAIHAGNNVQPVVDSKGIIKSESVRVEGAITESIEYDTNKSSPSGRPKITTVTDALYRIIGRVSGYGTLAVMRV